MCGICESAGLVYALKKFAQAMSQEYEYVFRCQCLLGSSDKRKALPEWSSSWARAYTLLTSEERQRRTKLNLERAIEAVAPKTAPPIAAAEAAEPPISLKEAEDLLNNGFEAEAIRRISLLPESDRASYRELYKNWRSTK